MKTGTAGASIGAALVVWFANHLLGASLDAAEGALAAGAIVSSVAWVIHHGGLRGLVKAITEGKP